MKIGICTIVDYSNYGNRLQNYALQEVLKNYGHEPQTIKNYYEKSIPKKSIISKIITTPPQKIVKKGLLKINKREIENKKKLEKILLKRRSRFKQFTELYIKESIDVIDNYTEDFSFEENLDCFIIGSDQVWNHNFPRFSAYDFVDYSKKPKIAYAASFGVNEIQDEYVAIYRRGLTDIDFLSVRENEGKEIISKLISKKAAVVLDPTLLLTLNEWEDLLVGLKKFKQKYILVYLLDNPKKEWLSFINNYAKNNKLKIITLSESAESEYWESGPLEFLNLIYQAETIFTDSFHGCVFSLIFEKEFTVFDRNTDIASMNSRLNTLLSDFSLIDRWFDGSNKEKINYLEIREKIDERRKDSLNYLFHSLTHIEEEMVKNE
ncbi:polysaccharide pyruvyl transferase family protein [Vagococcus carniphilus]|uniref:polysaccharide pyruvyl transferase family protein n=1 Tax=Vagococcus carniphilus TaxID=218144 RepID=UPI00288E0A72|nr:polysaccharide pyruvyl transferase family protein [Vagococcus carniphilus]MDT2815396.1 polysaccharide pyruvyl transferase family protein [Vagococcus carniphilus]MDT2865919.1 polysaccharide pyruvyl transferase family protein [Vagococcus carniphilus]